MIIGVLKEPTPETRVSLLPEHLTLLKKWKVETYIESTAGVTAFANDDKYKEANKVREKAHFRSLTSHKINRIQSGKP